jgi:hypothetical protein
VFSRGFPVSGWLEFTNGSGWACDTGGGVSGQTFEYEDYHRTIIGYHGTTAEAADRLVSGDPFNPSDNDDEWFGRGIYFWEYAPKQAWWWSEDFKRGENPAVIGAIIRLGNCFDLLDPKNLDVLRAVHKRMTEMMTAQDLRIPRNGRHHRYLDCAVFNWFYREAEQANTPIDSARAVYVPTAHAKRIWKGSWIYDEAHIQICVRNSKNILAVWHVRRDGRYGKPTAGDGSGASAGGQGGEEAAGG